MSKSLLVSELFCISVGHLLQQLYWHPQNLEQANCNFAHVHDNILHSDAKRGKYILN